MKEKPQTAQALPQVQIQPKIQLKNSMEVRMDRFKLDLSNMRKNISWKPKQPRIEEIEHVHFFYTFDENGRPQTYSVPTGGHFHKIDWSMDIDGNLIAKCGPALRYNYKKLANGTVKKVIEPVQYNAQKETQDGVEDYLIKDDHSHQCRYLYSEYFTSQHKMEIQRANKESIGPVQAKAASTAATGQVPPGFSLEGSKLD